MTNTGSPPPDPTQGDSKAQGGWLSWALIIGGGVLLILALLLGGRLVTVLYAILFPPLPPLPANVTEISHTSSDYGVDQWDYSTPDSVVDVVDFYDSQDAECSYPDDLRSTGSMSRCTGKIDFSIFTMQWQADITISRTNPDETTLTVSREVFWIGTGRQEAVATQDPS